MYILTAVLDTCMIIYDSILCVLLVTPTFTNHAYPADKLSISPLACSHWSPLFCSCWEPRHLTRSTLLQAVVTETSSNLLLPTLLSRQSKASAHGGAPGPTSGSPQELLTFPGAGPLGGATPSILVHLFQKMLYNDSLSLGVRIRVTRVAQV